MKKRNYAKDENGAIEILEKNGWVFGYLSGHGESECVFDTIGGKWLVVGDAEKRMVVLEPNGKAKEPWEY